MRRRLVTACLAAALAGASERSAFAQVRPPDAIVVTARADAPRGAAAGGAGGVEWLRYVGDASGLHTGGQSGSLGGAWWAYARFGGFTRKGTFTLTGAADLGASRTQTTSPFWRYSAGAAKRLQPLSIVVDGEFQQFEADGHGQHFFRVGAALPVAGILDVRTSYFMIADGGSLTPAVLARVDLIVNERRLLMGAVLSRRAVAQPLLTNGGVLMQTSQEWFLGYSTPVRGSSLVTTLNLLRHESSQVVRLELGLRVPLAKKGSTP